MTYSIKTLTTTHEGRIFNRKSDHIEPKGPVVVVVMSNADSGNFIAGIKVESSMYCINRSIGNANNPLLFRWDYCVSKIDVHTE